MAEWAVVAAWEVTKFSGSSFVEYFADNTFPNLGGMGGMGLPILGGLAGGLLLVCLSCKAMLRGTFQCYLHILG